MLRRCGQRFRSYASTPAAKPRYGAGLNRIVALVETHDRLLAQVLQREEMKRMGLKPTELRQQLLLPEGQAAAVVLDARWMAQL